MRIAFAAVAVLLYAPSTLAFAPPACCAAAVSAASVSAPAAPNRSCKAQVLKLFGSDFPPADINGETEDGMQDDRTNKQFVQDTVVRQDENHGEVLAFAPPARCTADVFPADTSSNRSCKTLLVKSTGSDFANSGDVNGETEDGMQDDMTKNSHKNHGQTLAFSPGHALCAADAFPADAYANRSCEKFLCEPSSLDFASGDETKEEMRAQDKMQNNTLKKRLVQDAHARQDDNHGVTRRHISLRLGTGSLGSGVLLKKHKTTATQRHTPIQGTAPPGIQPSVLRHANALPAAALAILLCFTPPVAAAPTTTPDTTIVMNKETVLQSETLDKRVSKLEEQGEQQGKDLEELKKQGKKQGEDISKIIELLKSSLLPSQASKGNTLTEYFSNDAVLTGVATVIVGVFGFYFMYETRKDMMEQRKEDMEQRKKDMVLMMEQRKEDMALMMEQRKEDMALMMEQRKEDRLLALIVAAVALYVYYNKP